MTNLLTLATEGAEGVSPDHIAADLAVPLAILIFGGAVYALVWSNYGAKKGALIYSTGFFGFTFMLGIFWWFGAPGTPVSTGLQNFPGQAPDAYVGGWYEFEPGSELATEYFPEAADGDLEGFMTAAEFTSGEGATAEDFESDPAFNALNGDLSSATGLMANLALRADSDGNIGLGGQARAEYQEIGEAELAEEVGAFLPLYEPAEPFYTASIDTDAGDQVLVREAGGLRLAGAEITTYVNYTSLEGSITIPVDEQVLYAFRDPGALWWPSAVWTFLSLLLFALSLFGLDRMEQREKEKVEQAEEPQRLAVPIEQ